MIKFYKQILYICICFSIVHGQNLRLNKEYLDSLKKGITGNYTKTTNPSVYNLIAAEYIKVYDADSVLKYAKKAVEFARLQEDKYQEASGYYNIAVGNRIAYDWRDYQKARKDYFENINRAINLFEKIGDKSKLAGSYLLLGNYYNRFGMPPGAFENYNKALKLFQEAQNEKGIAQCYSYLGQYFDVNNKPQEALPYFEKAAKTFEAKKDTIGLIYVLPMKSYCMKSLNNGIEQEALMRRTLNLAKGTENEYLLADIYCDLGLSLMDNHKAEESVVYLDMAYKKLLKYKADKLLSAISSNLAMAYSIMHNNELAYKYQLVADQHQKYYFAKLNRESLIEQKANLQYENDAKEGLIRFWAVMIISVILLLLVFSLVVMYRIKITTNNKLEESSKIISSQNKELNILNQGLEKKVAERTEELTKNNFELIKEVESRMVAEKSLNESEKRYRTLIEASPDGIIVQSKDKILFVNANLLKIKGAKNIEELNDDIEKFIINETNKKEFNKRKEAILNNNDSFPPMEMKIHNLNGNILEIEARCIVINFGGVKAIQTIIRNITEKKRVETELKKLSKAVEQSSAVIVITNPKGIIEYVNPKFEEVTGYIAEEVIGSTPRILKSGKMPPEMYVELWKTLRTGKEWHGEFLNKKKNGDLFWELCLISPVKDESGEVINFIAIKEDITQRILIQEEIIRSKKEAEEASRLKSTLLSNVSHEFRTPLNGILGFAQILKDAVENERLSNMAEKIMRSGRRLANTLDSVLILTELENKAFAVIKKEIDLTEFCKKITKRFENQADEQDLKLISNLPEKSIFVNADVHLLTKITAALLDNALKYTQYGEIHIELETIISSNGKDQVVLRVTDTGIGISYADQKIIFKEFIQVSEGFSRNFEGLGLGLSIVKKLADLAGYNITAQSEPGKGSVFSIYIPVEVFNTDEKTVIEVQPENKTEGFRTEDKARPRVLLVEDNIGNIEVVEHFLEECCDVESATSGETAISMAAENEYKLLLLDINLGVDLDGIDVLKEIKKSDKYKNVPAIALTGYAADKDRQSFMEHGFSGLLVKPFGKTELINMVKNYLSEELHS